MKAKGIFHGWWIVGAIFFESMYSDEEFNSYIKNLFKDMSMSPGYRFIVGMGDNLPFDSDIELVG